MESGVRRDLHISGIIGGQGGIYRTVNINGQGNIRGNLDCIEFACHGKATIHGSVKAETTEIHGLAHIKENFETKKVKVHGKTTVGGHLNAEYIEINGLLNVKGNCEAESFHAGGSFVIDGLLNADTVDVRLHGRCEAKEIGGGVIRIQKHGGGSRFNKLVQSILPKFGMLTTESVEGDDIHLEYTRAAVVRGTNVTIGPGCEIGLVEYKEHFRRDENSKVSKSRQV